MPDIQHRFSGFLKRRYKGWKEFVISPKGSRSTPPSSPNSRKVSFSSDMVFTNEEGVSVTAVELRNEPAPKFLEHSSDRTEDSATKLDQNEENVDKQTEEVEEAQDSDQVESPSSSCDQAETPSTSHEVTQVVHALILVGLSLLG